jgi:eukaryotic-like serine/threonine-protein kinase
MNPPEGEGTVFAEALRLPQDERAAYLAQATHGNAEMRRRVESLLGSYQAGDFLERAAAPELRPTLQTTVPLTEKPGDRIGHYKLLQQIGEGGCGVVYMAEQTEPVRRRVALKIIKLGMDTKSVIARFEAERQALAMMNHPNIAKVFDAGATEAGRPYFVMELVRGTKITEYCDEKKLPTDERLDLFVQVCHAIQHAHQKGIIHRDIKPSNILVSTDDGVAVPKVIDFGVAKATGGQKLTNKTVFTAFEQFIGTPAYMSPEQAVLTSLDIDTRSDIYALGVLLYELLTGQTPFDPKELLAIGLDEMRRTIRETEPPKPSTRLSTLPDQELSPTAQHRGLEAPKLVSELRGDLDWIVMKALEKDRARRYETANGLAMDIQRYLNNEPVVACPPSNIYQLRKWVRRNKLAFTAGVVIAAALIIGLGASTWMFLRERKARKRAVAAEQAQRKLREEAEMRELITQANQLSSWATDLEPAVQARKKALVEQRRLLGNDNPEIADSLEILGRFLTHQKKFSEADQVLQEALAIRRQNAPEGDLNVVHSLAKLALLLDDEQKWTEEEKARREAVEIVRRVRGGDNVETAMEIQNLGVFLSHHGQMVEAVARLREAFDTLRELSPDGDQQMAFVGRNLIDVLIDAGRLSEAADLTRDFAPQNIGAQPDLAVQVRRLVDGLFKQGSSEEAEAILAFYISKTPEMLRTLQGNENVDTANAINELGAVLCEHDKKAEALPFFRKTFAILRMRLSNGDPNLAFVGRTLIMVLIDTGRLSEATELVRDFVPQNLKVQPNLGDQVGRLANELFAQGKSQEAEQMLNDLVSKTPHSSDLLRVRARYWAQRGRWKEAAAGFIELTEAKPEGKNHTPVYSEDWHKLATLLVQSGNLTRYREQCQWGVEHFGDTRDLATAHRIAKDCLILPDSGVDLRVVGRLADLCTNGGNKWGPYGATKALTDYRQGRFASAADWAEQTLAHRIGEPNWLTVETSAILAMARRQLKQDELAQAALTRAQSEANKHLSKLDSGDVSADFLDVIISYALLHEAKALIEGGSEPKRK